LYLTPTGAVSAILKLFLTSVGVAVFSPISITSGKFVAGTSLLYAAILFISADTEPTLLVLAIYSSCDPAGRGPEDIFSNCKLTIPICEFFLPVTVMENNDPTVLKLIKSSMGSAPPPAGPVGPVSDENIEVNNDSNARSARAAVKVGKTLKDVIDSIYIKPNINKNDFFLTN
jgi:hypothetical protein